MERRWDLFIYLFILADYLSNGFGSIGNVTSNISHALLLSL